MTAPSFGTVNVNEATAEQLDAVESLAGHGFEIVRYREERGGFTDLRQLDEVPGLAGKLGDDDRALLTVGDRSAANLEKDR